MLEYEVRTYDKYVIVTLDLKDGFTKEFLNYHETKWLIGDLKDLINELESKLESLPE